MKTNSKCAAVRLEKSRLLAALAVLAVAFVVLAAVPAVADDSNATVSSDAVASIGDTGYASISEAVEKSTDGATIRIDKDTTSSRIEINDKAITIDFNSKNVIGPDKAELFKITGSGSLTVKGNGTTTGFAFASATDGGKLTVENGRFTGTEYGILFYKNAEVTINGGTISGGDNAGVMSNGTKGLGGSKLTINGGTIIGNTTSVEKYRNCGLYLPNGETTIINGGTIKGTNGAGIVLRGGSLTVNGGIIEGHGSAGEKGKMMGDSVATFCGGIEIGFDAKYPAGIGTIEINGGTISSDSVESFKIIGDKTEGSSIKITGGTFLNKSISTKDVTINVKSTLKADIEFAAKNDSMSISNGGVYTGTITSADGSIAQINVTAGTDGFTITDGSIDFSGAVKEVVGNKIIVKSGNAKVSGNTSIPKGMTLTIDENATLSIDANKTLTIDEGASLVIAGKVDGNGNLTNNGTIQLINEKATIPSTIGGTGSVDTSTIASEGTISGDWNTVTTYTSNQTITLTGDTVLKSGSQIVVMGKLIIPEGVTLTIEDGAQLVIFSSTGILENNGTIDVQSNAGSVTSSDWSQSALVDKANTGGLVNLDAEIVNNGTIDLNYSLPSDATDKYATNPQFNNSGKLTNNGQINVGTESFLYIWENMVNSAGATITVNGLIMHDGSDKKTISNAGSMIFNGEIREKGMSVSLTSDDAKVEFVSLSSLIAQNTITVSNGIEKKSGSTSVITSGSTANIVITVPKDVSIKGIVLTAALEKNADDDKKYDRYMVAEGSVSRGYTSETDSKDLIAIAVSGKIKVDSDLVLGTAIDMTVHGELYVNGTMASVAGTLDTTSTTYGQITIDTGGKIFVSGKLTASKEVTKTGMNAAYYSVSATTSTPASYVYTTLDQAVADGAKKIEIFGTTEVKVDIDVPSGTTVTLKESGAELKITKDSKVSFVSGAILNNAQAIKVKGTLYIETVKTGLKGAGSITSEVVINGEKDRTYTTLANAISMAAAGSTIELSGNVEIKSDVTIPEGIKVDTKGHTVTVFANYTLTVDGELFLNESDLILNKKDTTKIEEDGKVVNNGTISATNNVYSVVKLGTDAYTVPGAYYSITEKTTTTYYVQPVAKAAADIAKADGLKLEIRSQDAENGIVIGDVSFTGTADAAASVVVMTKLTATSITLDLASISFSGEQAFKGTITNGVGTVNIAGKANDGFVVASSTSENVKTLAVAGKFTDSGKDDKFTVSGDATLATANISKMTVDGNVKIAKGTSSDTTTIGTLVINGAVEVQNAAKLNVTGNVEVLGTLTAAAMTDSDAAGSITVKDAYVGITAKNSTRNYTPTTAASATVSGKITVSGYAIVADGSAIPESITAAETVKTTAYLVDGKAYVTVYAFTDTYIGKVKASVSDAFWIGWYSGTKTTVDVSNQLVGSNGNETVNAIINYNIYNITLKADAGIENVAIDGNLMDYNAFTGEYEIIGLKSGSHTVTYTLKNGYSGVATLTVNGEKQSGLSFTASGNPASGENTVSYALQLSGVTASGYVDPTPVTPSEDKDGLTITDYLLIVLVVLIVIMAIIVAMRLMRS